MSDDSEYYDQMRRRQAELPSDIKLALLRSELLRHIETVRGIADVLEKADLKDLQDDPKEYRHLVTTLTKAANSLRDTLDAITGF